MPLPGLRLLPYGATNSDGVIVSVSVQRAPQRIPWAKEDLCCSGGLRGSGAAGQTRCDSREDRRHDEKHSRAETADDVSRATASVCGGHGGTSLTEWVMRCLALGFHGCVDVGDSSTHRSVPPGSGVPGPAKRPGRWTSLRSSGPTKAFTGGQHQSMNDVRMMHPPPSPGQSWLARDPAALAIMAWY